MKKFESLGRSLNSLEMKNILGGVMQDPPEGIGSCSFSYQDGNGNTSYVNYSYVTTDPEGECNSACRNMAGPGGCCDNIWYN